MVSKLIPYRNIFFTSSLPVEEVREKLKLITERENKGFIDLSRIDSFEGIIHTNSFILSRGPSSLTVGKMSYIPVFIGTLFNNTEGGTNIKVLARLNYLGSVIGFCVILFFIIAFRFISIKQGLFQSIPTLLLILILYFSTMREFNKSVNAFRLLLVKSSIIK